MSDKIKMLYAPRALLERAIYWLRLGEPDGPTVRELRTLLAAPIVQRQSSAFIYRLKCRGGVNDFVKASAHLTELAELQTTIEQLRAEIEQLSELRKRWIRRTLKARDERDRLKAEIERQKDGQGKPILIQAVAVTRKDEDEGLRLEWLLEGGIAEMEFSGMVLFALPEANDLCAEDGSAEIYTSQPAPVLVAHPFADKIIHKLQRFMECADDGQGADIGRQWFDLLTQLGLLNRVQRSPALWEITQQGEDCLNIVKELNP